MSATLALIALLAVGQEASVHGRSRTTVIVGTQPLYSVNQGALELQRFAPIVEELSLEAATGIEGVTINAAAWTAIDAGERFQGDRTVADLTFAVLQWKTAHLDLRAGRLFLYSDVARATHFDGGAFAARASSGPVHLEAEAWAGVPVSTAYGDEPLRDAFPEAARDPLFYAPRGSDWSRPGDVVFGARAAGSLFDRVELGLGYARESNLAITDRESFSGHVHLAPWGSIALDGFASYDVYASALEDSELALSYWPLEGLRTAIYGRTRVPGMTLPSSSIFSVFANERHADAGVETDLFLEGRTRLSASAELRRSALEDGTDSALGYRLTAAARHRLVFWPGARTSLSYERLSDAWFGRYDYLRASVELPVSETIAVSPDAGVFLVDARAAGRIGIAGSMRIADQLLLVIAARGTREQSGANELAVIGRIEWSALPAPFSEDAAPIEPAFAHATKLQEGATCTDCHATLDRANTAQLRGLVFSHVMHEKPSSGNCMRCHQAVATAMTKPELPAMETCADGCHREDFQERRCKTCHLDLARYPLESIKTWSHGREFERRHGPSARRDATTCTTCHEATWCSDCHSDQDAIALDRRRIEQPVRAFIHPAPYITVHALDASSGKDRCDTCHRPTFCTSCHAQRGLAGVDASKMTPHPNGWLDPTSLSFHGMEAKRSIASCAGCHDQGARSNCVRCHQVGGVGGSPHPHDFARRDDPKQNRMCRTCHI